MSLKVLGKCDACAKLIGCLSQSQLSILLHCPMRGENKGHMERGPFESLHETGASWQFWADGALMLRLGKGNMGMKFFFLWCFALVETVPKMICLSSQPSSLFPSTSSHPFFHRGPVAYHQPFIRVIISPRFIDRAVLLEFSISLPSSPLGLTDPVFHSPLSTNNHPPDLRLRFGLHPPPPLPHLR